MTQTKTPPRSLPTLAATLALVTALSSCTTPTPSTTPSMGAPTFACTPEAGGSPYPCSSADYQEMKRKDALYAEAEQVFRRLIAEDERMYRGGGAEVLSAEYIAILGTQELRDEQLAISKSVRSDKIHTEGPFAVTKIKGLPGLVLEGSEVAIQGCEDMTGARFYKAGVFDSHGRATTIKLFLARKDSSLVVVAVTSTPDKSC